MIILTGICYDENSSYLKGPAKAPAIIREMDIGGSANAWSENGWHIERNNFYKDVGDLNIEQLQPADAFVAIQHHIENLLYDHNKILTLGGDHSISYPIIDSFTNHHKNLHVIHFDAHADLYENFEQNPYSHASPFARLLEKGNLASITQVGIRTLNAHQRQQAERYEVNIIEMKDFSPNKFITQKSPLYISLDMDVLDPAFAPGVSHHEPGGMSVRDLINAIQQINGVVVGCDIVEYNPLRDVNGQTAMVAYKLMKELMVKMN